MIAACAPPARADDFVELKRLAQTGHLERLVAELLLCHRKGGLLILCAALRSLDAMRVSDQGVSVAIAGKATEALAVRDVHSVIDALALVTECAKLGEEQQIRLMSCKAVPSVLSAMAAFRDDASVQWLGMEANSWIIGSSDERLQQFVSANGLHHVQESMQRHPGDKKLQLKAIKQIASQVLWPDELRQEARFAPDRAIALTKQAMLLHSSDVEIQLSGMDALKKLVGESFEDLFAFASCGGLEIIEQAMLRFPEDIRVQESCLKALSGGAIWPDEVCQRIGYCPERALAFMKQAMSLHLDDEAFQRMATARLRKNFLRHHSDAVSRCGGGDLVRAIMVQHHGGDVHECCKQILIAIGEPLPSVAAYVSASDGCRAVASVLELASVSGT